jgi:hypothetical protein
LPARFTAEQAGWVLKLKAHDIHAGQPPAPQAAWESFQKLREVFLNCRRSGNGQRPRMAGQNVKRYHPALAAHLSDSLPDCYISS